MGKPKAKVDKKKCLACGGCISVCPQDAISMCASKAFITSENVLAVLFVFEHVQLVQYQVRCIKI